MKIMGRVARLILLVVVSVCVVFCVLCCLQNNPVFLSVTIISYFQKWKLWAMDFGGFLHRSDYNRKKLRPEKKGRVRDRYYDRKKKDTVVCLAGARLLLWPEKKSSTVVCLAGARSFLRPEKKVLVVCLAGAWLLLRPEKKILVICWAQPVPITTEKKKIQSSVRCYAVPNTTGKKNKNLAGAQSLLRLEKKKF